MLNLVDDQAACLILTVEELEHLTMSRLMYTEVSASSVERWR